MLIVVVSRFSCGVGGAYIVGGFFVYATLRTLQPQALRPSKSSPDTVQMAAFFANSKKEHRLQQLIEENLQQTSITRSGSPHNALHCLVMLILRCFGTVCLPQT